MKKIKITENDLRLLILLGALLLLAASYFLIYTPNLAKMENVRTTNEAKAEQVKKLQGMLLKKQEETERMEEMKKNIEDIKACFPAMLTEEKAIYIMEQMEMASGIRVDSLSFNMENPYFMGDGVAIAGMQSQVSASFKGASYEEIKKAVEFINDYDDRMTIENLSCSYNEESNDLSGSLNINLYAMQGIGKVYEPPVILGIPKGLKNIFRNGD